VIDMFSIQPGDMVLYKSYRCSESLSHERFTGIYQDFMLWSPDERPVELWVILTKQSGQRVFVRASQVVNVFRSSAK
jgi:hypothetical protein